MKAMDFGLGREWIMSTFGTLGCEPSAPALTIADGPHRLLSTSVAPPEPIAVVNPTYEPVNIALLPEKRDETSAGDPFTQGAASHMGVAALVGQDF